MESVTGRLRSSGASVVETPLPPSFSEVLKRHRVVMAVEAAAFHETRLRQHPDDYGPQITTLLEEGLACSAPEYVRRSRISGSSWKSFPLVRERGRAACSRHDWPGAFQRNHWRPRLQFALELHGLPYRFHPVRLVPRGPAAGNPARGPAKSEFDLLATAEWCEKSLEFDFREPPT